MDKQKDQVIEVGAVLYSTGQRKCLESLGILVKSTVQVTPEITKITGITQAAVDRFGYESKDAFETLSNLIDYADAFIGHNVRSFDKYMLQSWAAREERELPNKLWIDTMTDLPGVEPKKLSYLAADHGFINMFPHSALSDCQTVLKILESYDIDAVVERAKSPIIIIQSLQSRSNNEQAKKEKFRWNGVHKIWWKQFKEIDGPLTNRFSFDVKIRPDLTVEDLND